MSRQQFAERSRAFGITVMRCQGKAVTAGWRYLIETIASQYDVVVIFLGCTGGVAQEHDSLSYDIRAGMLRQAFPHINLLIQPLYDNPISHELWSYWLDQAIDDLVPAARGVQLYDGRDGFTDTYFGKYKDRCVRVPSLLSVSGTETRSECKIRNTEEVREALIAYEQKRYGYGYSAADIVIYDPLHDRFLLTAQLVFGDFRAFCGGHWDKSDVSLEFTADRERLEEVPGITTTPARQLYTMPVANPRYRYSKKDGMVTTISVSRYIDGEPQAADDVELVEWVQRADLIERLVPWHRPLGQYVLDHWSRVCELLEIDVREPIR